eukprot:CAMPEP_0174964228 /NCGR_PEP_ID=MMETSP0004_2-20121128/5764_1 /TAXON_ID=420556 /ORGANISM="Ochromonas sp., Strain CCMP1393" /LENGTH=31 /DNA_ID= /DNA_START= /DNA_END= /DNA_ORIENTATION=
MEAREALAGPRTIVAMTSSRTIATGFVAKSA